MEQSFIMGFGSVTWKYKNNKSTGCVAKCLRLSETELEKKELLANL